MMPSNFCARISCSSNLTSGSVYFSKTRGSNPSPTAIAACRPHSPSGCRVDKSKAGSRAEGQRAFVKVPDEIGQRENARRLVAVDACEVRRPGCAA